MKYFELLSQSDMETIHENILYTLENVGIAFEYDLAREVLKKNGCNVENKIVRFPRKIVEERLKQAPREFTLHGRTPERNVTFNMDAFITIPAYGSPYVHHHGEERRDGLKDDFIKFTKLTQQSPHLDLLSAVPCEMADVPQAKWDPEYIRTLLTYSEKPFVVAKTAEAVKAAFDECVLLYDTPEGLAKNPRFITITDSLSPLSFDTTMTRMLFFCAENNIPQRIGCLGAAGLTTPVTWAGNLTQMFAESLAGIVLTQCIRPGAPVVINNSSSAADMRNLGLTVGAPESAINCIGTVQMAHFYGLPVRSGGAISDSKVVDAQAGAESMMNLMASALSGVNYVLHACGILEAYMVSSLEKFIVDEECCGMVRHIRKGIPVNEETLARQCIADVGPGGTYLLHDHTLENYRTLYEPMVFDRQDWNHWEADGSVDCAERAKKVWQKRIAEFEVPQLSAAETKTLDDFVKNYKP